MGPFLDHLIDWTIQEEITGNLLFCLFPEFLLKFLGFKCIINDDVKTRDDMIKTCQVVKAFVDFLQETPDALGEDAREIHQILESHEFFIECLNAYPGHPEKAWNQKYKGWRKWHEENIEQEGKKVRLSEEKRKLFGDIRDYKA